ncbi:BQ2448_6966 [Microbotryum intermedium]|uniref:BQ2448_6966 protein n=1 Tax=Microbotryum intermedium TaxID=269621 RepID=A0A238FLK0_9BASI|nr:BQ2448_6966 [Microbotryum intermedium]
MASTLPRLTTHIIVSGGTFAFLLQKQTLHAEDEQAELAPAAGSRRAAVSGLSMAIVEVSLSRHERIHAIFKTHLIGCDHASSQLPIYDKVPGPPSLLPAHTPLHDEAAHARRWLQTSYAQLHAHAREGARTWIGWEGKAEGQHTELVWLSEFGSHRAHSEFDADCTRAAQMKSMIAPDEALVPGGLYVAIATLTGSILARNRTSYRKTGCSGFRTALVTSVSPAHLSAGNFFLRLALPGVCFGGALVYFLPKTASETTAQLQAVQQRHAPALTNTFLAMLGKGQSHS